PLEDLLHAATAAFAEVVALAPEPAAQGRARAALELGYQAADALTAAYVEQLLATRLQREGRLTTLLGCRLPVLPPEGGRDAVRAACNAAVLPLTWRQIEPIESQYHWDEADAALDWALAQGLAVSAGPLIDFSQGGLPDWLTLWENDLPSLASFLCDYVETAVARYRNRVRRWQLTAAANCAGVLSLGEDDLLRLTARLAEAAWSIDPELELVIGLAQPWGEYMADEEHTYSPFVFADTLLRAGLRLAAIDLELFPGVAGRGSFCRDPLEASRLLDLYSVLGVPLQVTCGYPSAAGPDPQAA